MRRFIVAIECFKHLENARTSFAALEMEREMKIVEGLKESLLREIRSILG